MDIELEKKLAIIGGQSPEEFDRNQLAESDRVLISNALDILFSGLSLSNWLDGGTLYDAWQKSLKQIHGLVYEIKAINSAVMYLRAAALDQRNRQSNMMISSRNSNNLIQCPSQSRDGWRAHADSQINEGIAIIRQKIEEFDTDAPRAAAAQKNNQPDMDRNLMRQEMGRTREHERERMRK